MVARSGCARKTLELAGVIQIDRIDLHRLGLRKGDCPVTEETVTSRSASRRPKPRSLPSLDKCYDALLTGRDSGRDPRDELFRLWKQHRVFEWIWSAKVGFEILQAREQGPVGVARVEWGWKP